VSYQVLARKWRPQAFETVVGQDAITRTLRNALASSRIAHAYLFAGPRGVGKTTTARLLAKALLCPERKADEPCGVCGACREVQAGSAVDVIEIDGASNRKIDDVRTLRENVKYAPARGRYKVYIIDEVHQLTGDAFDALLKTLEEPPPHVVFILATTDPRDIPPTVLSRVQRFDFKPISPQVLLESLQRILKEEGTTFDPAALPLIVRAAEGSLRDALSLLDTALAYGGGTLEAAATAQLLGTTAPAQVRAFAAAMLAFDAAAALQAVERAASDGEDVGVLTRETIELLRRALTLKAAPAMSIPDLTPQERDELQALVESVSIDELLYVLRAFLEADAQMRESPHPRVELEIAVVRAARRPVPASVEEILKKIEDAEARFGQAAPPVTGAASRPVAAQGDLLTAPPVDVASVRVTRTPPAGGPGPDTITVTGSFQAGRPAPSRAETVPPSEPRSSPGAETPPAAPVAAPHGLAAAWKLVVEDVMSKRALLGSLVDQATPVGVVDGQLTVRLEGNPFNRNMLSERANRDIVTQAVRRYIPAATRFEVVAGEAAGGGIQEHPAVRAVVEQFGGEVVSVRPRAPEGESQ
jgi:DNA polymerase-3 subunit gamma/tau